MDPLLIRLTRKPHGMSQPTAYMFRDEHYGFYIDQ